MNRRHVISWAAFACLPPVAAQPAASAAPDRRDWLENFGPARQPWIDKLRSLRQGRAEVFRIVQIGDSHTAGDFFTGGLRAALQERWGNAGAGWVWPVAVAGQRAAVMQCAASGWRERVSSVQPASRSSCSASARPRPRDAPVRMKSFSCRSVMAAYSKEGANKGGRKMVLALFPLGRNAMEKGANSRLDEVWRRRAAGREREHFVARGRNENGVLPLRRK